MRSLALGAIAAAIVAAAPASSALAFCTNPNALGVSRVITLDTTHGLEVGRNEFHHTLALQPKEVVLTFDDGPDPKYTPQILSILERYHVPGTFFVIGENGVSNRGLLERIIASGSEIGNHSYTHPNMADMSDTGARLELNATQRLIEAYTGRSTRLFRAPYFGDAEPTTPDEIGRAHV